MGRETMARDEAYQKGGDTRDADREGSAKSASSNNETKILAAAEHVFAKYGYRGATTALIASKAGVTKPNIYYYSATRRLSTAASCTASWPSGPIVLT